MWTNRTCLTGALVPDRVHGPRLVTQPVPRLLLGTLAQAVLLGVGHATCEDTLRSEGGHRVACCQGYTQTVDTWAIASTRMQMRDPAAQNEARNGKRTGAGAMLFPGHYASVSKPKEPENSSQS